MWFNTIICLQTTKMRSYNSNYEYLTFWSFKKYVPTNGTEKKCFFLNREFSGEIFLVPFWCTYLFWDNLTSIIEKFINCRIFYAPLSLSKGNTLECISFENFLKKDFSWKFQKISFGRKSLVFLTKILKMKIF